MSTGVRHSRILVQKPTDSVTDEICVYCEPCCVCRLLNHLGDLSDTVSGLADFDCVVERLLSDIYLISKEVLYHSFHFWIYFSESHHDRVVTKISIFVAGNIEINPISFFENSCVWYPMT